MLLFDLRMILLKRSPISLSPLAEHVIERAAFRDVDQAISVGLCLIGDVLHKQQRQDVVLLLTGVHAAAQFIAGIPERAIEV